MRRGWVGSLGAGSGALCPSIVTTRECRGKVLGCRLPEFRRQEFRGHHTEFSPQLMVQNELERAGTPCETPDGIAFSTHLSCSQTLVEPANVKLIKRSQIIQCMDISQLTTCTGSSTATSTLTRNGLLPATNRCGSRSSGPVVDWTVADGQATMGPYVARSPEPSGLGRSGSARASNCSLHSAGFPHPGDLT
jgi:hypothetical protein